MIFCKNKANFIYLTFLILICAFGIYLRIKTYLINPSMWYDEASLALNVTRNIFFPPLLNNQSAPFLFLVFTKILSLIKYNDYIFRLIPLISSILSIFMFYFFSCDFLKSKTSRAAALFIFCINFQLIYFSREFKPYSTDVLIYMALIYFYFKINFQAIKPLKAFGFGALFSLFPLLSFSSLFLYAPLIIFPFFKKNYKNASLFALPIIISLPIYYFTFLSKYSANNLLQTFWQDGFITFKTFLPTIFNMFDFFLSPYFANIFLIITFIVGLIMCFKKEPQKTLFVLTSFFSLAAASFLHKYPIEQRLVLFLLPIFLIFTFKVLDFEKKKIIIGIILIVLSFGAYVKPNLERVYDKRLYYRESITGLLDTIKKEYKEGDIIFPLPWSHYAFQYYNQKYKFKEDSFLFFENNSVKNYTKAFENIPKGRYWLIFTIEASNYERYKALEKWLKKDFKIINVYQDHYSRMFYAEKIR